MNVSIIIPTLNEAQHVGRLLEHLIKNGGPELLEIWISDAQSDDKTVEIAEKYGVHLLKNQPRSRAKQMNAAARIAQGDVLYFVHADTLPPSTFLADIRSAIEKGHDIGGYRFRFDSDKAMLKFNSWMTRFNVQSFRGGDQSLFITRKLWNELSGFDEKYIIMEEYDLLRRAKKIATFGLIPKEVLVSARKYEQSSWMRVNFANLLAMVQFRCGVDPVVIKRTYCNMLRNRIIGYRST
jgi:rSAM/selenodomain-associated transferase 2